MKQSYASVLSARVCVHVVQIVVLYVPLSADSHGIQSKSLAIFSAGRCFVLLLLGARGLYRGQGLLLSHPGMIAVRYCR